MPLKKILLLVCCIISYQLACSQLPKTLGTKIDSLTASDTIDFSVLTKQENQLIISLTDTTGYKEDDIPFDLEDRFINARARLTIYHNNKLITAADEKSSDRFVTGFCYAYSGEDTITINTSIGFFSGLGFGIFINKENFTSVLYPVDDNGIEIYTWNKDDSVRLMKIEVPAINQRLSLSWSYNSKGDLILTGRLKADFKEYYDIYNNQEIPEKQKYSVDIVFRCKVDVESISKEE